MDQSRAFIAPGQNRLLSALSRDLQLRLLPKTERVSLPIRCLLYEAGAPISHVWFPLSGVISLAVTMKDGVEMEVGTVGNEGLVGTQAFLGAERSLVKASCLVPGQALQMSVGAFRRSLQEHPELHEMVRRHTDAMFTQLAQSTACGHAHGVEARLCRWLLTTQDRVGADEFQLTQEFLARTLGVRRPSVTIAAGVLQKRGLIRYQRGRIRIVDRASLEAGACECYEVVRREMDRLLVFPR